MDLARTVIHLAFNSANARERSERFIWKHVQDRDTIEVFVAIEDVRYAVPMAWGVDITITVRPEATAQCGKPLPTHDYNTCPHSPMAIDISTRVAENIAGSLCEALRVAQRGDYSSPRRGPVEPLWCWIEGLAFANAVKIVTTEGK